MYALANKMYAQMNKMYAQMNKMYAFAIIVISNQIHFHKSQKDMLDLNKNKIIYMATLLVEKRSTQ